MIRVTINRVESFADGTAMDAAGAFERVFATVQGALDPKAPSNQAIVNLAKAPRNSAGTVDYEADLFILRPADPARRNRKILYEFANRGNKLFLPWVNGAPETTPVANNDPRTLADAGTGFLLRDGWTLAWSGWDGTAALRQPPMGIRLPVATDHGQMIVKRIREEFVPGGPLAPDVLSFPLTYDVADPRPELARLTMRYREADVRVEIPHDRWTYAGNRAVQLLPLETEFERGAIYDFWYPAKNPPVLGTGLAAVRDVLSWLRYGQGEPVRAMLGLGISLGGRFAQEFLLLGMNADLQGRQLLDGVLTYLAGTGRTFVNFEFGQPARTRNQHRDHHIPESWFPFSYAKIKDPVSGREASFLPEASPPPRVMSVNSSSEYWHKGASLTHTDPAGEHDLALPENVRAYLIAGTQHDAIASQQQGRGPCACCRNPHSPTPVLRALIAALDAWTCDDIPPPESNVPTLADNTLVGADALKFPLIADLPRPARANDIVPPFDWIDPPQHLPTPYRSLVCQVDDGGNEIAGIRTPDIAVPLGTHTGWNFHDTEPTRGELFNHTGAFIPFARTRAERLASGDVRASLEELYGNRASYIAQVRAIAAQLVAQRLLLPEDADSYLHRAMETAEF